MEEQHPRIDWHLYNWARWQRTGRIVEGYADHATGCPAYSGSTHLDDMYDSMDHATAEAVDTIVNDLPPAQSCALHHRYLNAVYRFSARYPYAQTLSDAREAIGRGLRAKNIY